MSDRKAGKSAGSQAGKGSAGPTFRELYLSADRRVLAAARIGFGGVLIYDLVRRWRELELLYTNDGILPNHFALFRPQDRPQFSFLTPFSTFGEATFAFSCVLVLYLFYTFGLFTRVSQALVLLAITSLNSRNLFAEDGGVATMIAFAVWTVFLPLGDRFSLDVLRREAVLRNVRARVRARSKLEKPVVSRAVLALTLQIIVIYLLNALHKTGSTWSQGSAVHYVLWQARVNTDFAWWLAHHEPGWLSPLFTRATLVIEYAIPLLVIYPYRVLPRVAAFLLACSLHLGIALVMTLGPFSYAMIALVSTRLPPEALNAVAARVPRSLRPKWFRMRQRLVRALSSRLARRDPPRPAARPLPWGLAREATVVFLMIAAGVEMSQANPAIRLKVPQPEWLRAVILYPRLTQRWSMFAPEAPLDDGYGVVDAVTADGRHVDPFTGAPPDFDRLDKGPIPETVEAVDYLFQIHHRHNERYRSELIRYVERWHEREQRPESDRLVGFTLYWVTRDSPRPGSTEPGPTRRERVLEHRGRR